MKLILNYKEWDIGIPFKYHGDLVWWRWPWKRKLDKRPWLSLLASGNGEFGDAAFESIKAMDKFWDDACQKSS